MRGGERPGEPEQILVLPLRNSVLFPMAVVPINVGRPRSVRLVEELDVEELESRRRRWLHVDARDRAAARNVLATAGFLPVNAPDGALLLSGTGPAASPDLISRTLVEAGSPPTHLSVEQEDLETYFLRLIGAADGGDR